MGSRPRFRSPCVTAPAHLLPYAPLYPLLPVLTRCAASYPPGLAALCRVPAVLRGLRLARSPLRYRLASPALLSEPRFPSARTLRGSALPVYPSPPLCAVAAPSPSYRMGCRPLCRRRPLSLLPGWTGAPPPAAHVAPTLLLPGWVGALGAAERAGRCYPRFGAARRPPARVSGAGGSAPRRPGERSASPIRPSCGACEISRPRQLRPPTATLR